ncbi:MAG: ThuA domain-containing protein [Phycisphaerales bacterium]
MFIFRIAIAIVFAAVASRLAPPTSKPSSPLPPPTLAPAAPGAAAPAAPVKLFYCTQSAGFRHDVLPETREIVKKLGDDLDWLDVTISDDVKDLTPDVLRSIDVLMLYTTGTLPMSDEQKAALKAFVERGGGIVGIHSASDTFHDWDWFVETIGGEFDGHPWHEKVAIVVLDKDHPAVRHLAPRFEITDEIYQFKRLNDRRNTLMALDTTSVTHDSDPQRAYPLAWTLNFGKGRVFYTALGHRSEVWRDKRFIDHLLGGVKWAAGRGG